MSTSCKLRTVATDNLEAIAEALLAAASPEDALFHGPLLVRAVVGPRTLAPDGDAYRIAVQSLFLDRSPEWPTWRDTLDEARREWILLPPAKSRVAAFRHACDANLPLLARFALATRTEKDVFSEYVFSWELGNACRVGHLPRVRQLLAYIDANIIFDGGNGTALMQAASFNRLDVVKLLLAHGAGATIDTFDDWGHSALMNAVVAGHVDVARALIEGGANVNARCKHGWMALARACERQGRRTNPALVELLLRAGAEVDDRALFNIDKVTSVP